MAELRIFTWYWRQPGGRTDYREHHVNIWASQVRRHLTLPHRLACVTAHPEGIDPSIEIITPPGDFEDVELPTWGIDRGLPQCLRRIALFRPDAADIFGERFVSMDMDCVIAESLDPLFDHDDDFRMYQGTTAKRPYNGSMIQMTAGCRSRVYTEFTPEKAVEAGQKYLGSDQAWISYVLGPGERVWNEQDGVVWYGSSRNANAPTRRLMFFPGAPKPWTVVRHRLDPWIAENYRGDRGGRCLVLGYGASVWADAEAALATGGFDAVIASPEAARYWPGEVLETVFSDADAAPVARMHGFDDVVFCGRTEREAA